jgi:hypothetical protein
LADGLAVQQYRLGRATPAAAELGIVRGVVPDSVMLDRKRALTILLPPHILSVEDKAAVSDNGQIYAPADWFFDVHRVFNVQTRMHAVILPLHASGFLTSRAEQAAQPEFVLECFGAVERT